MQSLQQTVQSVGALKPRDAVGWALRLCQRLGRLHQLGVAHGGITTRAILLAGPSPERRGILRDVRQSPPDAAFHSPERLAGHGISPADDTWAAAAILFFTLTKTLPFGPGPEAQVRRQLAQAGVPSLSPFGGEVASLQPLINRFLNPDQNGRGAQIGELTQALTRLFGAGPPLMPLDEEEDEEEEDDDDVQTVMRDSTELQAELAAAAAAGGADLDSEPPTMIADRSDLPDLDALAAAAASRPQGAARPAPDRARQDRSAPSRKALSRTAPTKPPPAPRAPARPAAGNRAGPKPAFVPPARPSAPTAVGGFDAHRLARSQRQAAPANGAPVRPSTPPGPQISRPPPLPSDPKGPPPVFDLTDEDSEDEEMATVMMDSPDEGLAAAIQKALDDQQRRAASLPPKAMPTSRNMSGGLTFQGNVVSPVANLGTPLGAPEPIDLEALARQAELERPKRSSGKAVALLLLLVVVVVALIIYLRSVGAMSF